MLPVGAELPPLVYLVPLVLAFVGVAALTWAVHPPVTDWTPVAFAPWMLTGAVLHVLYQLDAYPDAIAPLFGTITVYITVATFTGLVWILMTFLAAIRQHFHVDRAVGTAGTGFGVMFLIFAILLAVDAGNFTPFWSVIGGVIAGIVTAVAWLLFSLKWTEVAAHVGKTGAFVVFAHTLDGITTAIGYDVLGSEERVALSRYVLEAGDRLPTAEVIGAGWLFVLVKIVLALVIVAAFKEYVDEEPRQARLLLTFVAAVGFGPGVHNLVLFTVSGQGAVSSLPFVMTLLPVVA
ncbi:DUF63 family protein [Haloarchaeobius amylolyticus]|uniref:DUF63 family protein n=1 Tax=Haloarchaeobius amylolyticus TaxID=1198296 RepID=UPI00226E0A79|nr:DUF63 family protein [Haloarchaeobius amylolyticus]